MRLILGLCALATSGSAASAQALDARVRRLRDHESLQPARDRLASPLAPPGDRRSADPQRAARDRPRADRAGARAARHARSPFPIRRSPPAFDQITGPFTLRRRAVASRSSLELDIPFPDKFRLNNRIGLGGHSRQRVELSAAAADDRAPGVGDLRLAARRAAAPRQPARSARPRERFPEAHADPLRRRHRGQARRHSGAGRASRRRTTI